jgi:hypothetical protein
LCTGHIKPPPFPASPSFFLPHSRVPELQKFAVRATYDWASIFAHLKLRDFVTTCGRKTTPQIYRPDFIFLLKNKKPLIKLAEKAVGVAMLSVCAHAHTCHVIQGTRRMYTYPVFSCNLLSYAPSLSNHPKNHSIWYHVREVRSGCFERQERKSHVCRKDDLEHTFSNSMLGQNAVRTRLCSFKTQPV